MGNNILVTGGAGFIGSNFLHDRLKNSSDDLFVNVDAITYAGNLENLKEISENENYIFEKANIENDLIIETICKKYNINGIINFAAESHVDRSISNSKPFINTNVLGTLNLLEISRKLEIENYLQVSTDEVYGSLGKTGAFTENSQIQPNSPYSASKASADHLVHSFGHTYDMNVKITRCSNNYGPFQFPEKLIPLMINNALENKDLPVYGDGKNVRDWLYVSDHCDAIWEVFNNGSSGEVYNIGGNCEKQNIEIVKLLLEMLDKPKSLIKYVKDRPGHDERYAIDNKKITSELNWEPKVSFSDGIKMTLDWYLQNKSWSDNVRSGAYLDFYQKWYGGLEK
jgi:dTDP-glucose 4,6-dehydratase